MVGKELKAVALYTFLILTLSLFGAHAHADISTTPVLREAEGLVDIIPDHSRLLTENFLNTRSLKINTNDNKVNRDSNSETRSPSSTVEALKILAKANFNQAFFTVWVFEVDPSIAIIVFLVFTTGHLCIVKSRITIAILCIHSTIIIVVDTVVTLCVTIPSFGSRLICAIWIVCIKPSVRIIIQQCVRQWKASAAQKRVGVLGAFLSPLRRHPAAAQLELRARERSSRYTHVLVTVTDTRTRTRTRTRTTERRYSH